MFALPFWGGVTVYHKAAGLSTTNLVFRHFRPAFFKADLQFIIRQQICQQQILFFSIIKVILHLNVRKLDYFKKIRLSWITMQRYNATKKLLRSNNSICCDVKFKNRELNQAIAMLSGVLYHIPIYPVFTGLLT